MMANPISRLQLSHTVLAIYWALLFAATHLDLSFPRPPGDLRSIPLDKAAHIVAYALLGILLAWSVQTHRSLGRHIAALLVIAFYAVVDEWSQSLLSYRMADKWDAVADVCGGMLGLISHSVWCHSTRWFLRGSTAAASNQSGG